MDGGSATASGVIQDSGLFSPFTHNHGPITSEVIGPWHNEANLPEFICTFPAFVNEEILLSQIKDFFKRKAGHVDIDAKDRRGLTALMLACSLGKRNLVEFLLEKGANPNLIDKNGDTALHIACLICRGANPITRDKALHIACQYCRCVLCSRYVSMIRGIHGIKATEEDEKTVEIVKLLLEHNSNVHLNLDGFSPIDYAALLVKDKTVEYIISNAALSKEEELNAFEILAFAFALKGELGDAYRLLVKAMEKRHADPDSPISKDFTSDLESLLGQKETQTLEELKALKMKNEKRAITVETILIGDRILQQKMKPCHIYDRVANYRLGLLFDSNTMGQGFSIFDYFLQYEQEGLVKAHV